MIVTGVKEWKEDLELKGFIPRIIHCSKEEMDNVIQIDTKRG